MSRRSKRETAPPPPPPQPQPSPSSSASINKAPLGSSERAGFPLQPAFMKAMPGAVAPGPCCGGLPVPSQVAYSNSCWWPSPSTAAGVAASGSQATQKDAIDPDLLEWGMDNRPPGGFVRLIGNQWSPLPQPIPPHLDDGRKGKGSPTGPVSKRHVQPQQLINLDNDDDSGNCARIERRLGWMAKEEERLVTAWLNNSNDPINGNCKKTDRYWGDVTNEYNNTTPKNRRRTSKQLKDNFQKIKKKVGWFCCAWKEATSIWPSGHSDDQLMDKAQAIYEQYKDGPFMLKHCWVMLRDEPKWEALLEDNLKPDKRTLNDEGRSGELMSSLAQSEDRPIGNKKAKLQAKKCPSQLDDVLQQLTKIQGSNESREKLLETQKHVSSEKLESARLNHLTAQENAKSAMLETYRTLSMKDTSGMPDDVKAEHLAFMRSVRESIFGKN